MTEDGTDDAGTDDAGTEDSPEQRRALFHVVRGAPDDAELAALTVVLAAAAAAGRAGAPPGPTTVWNDPAARMRTPLRPGPSAWRTSTWPR